MSFGAIYGTCIGLGLAKSWILGKLRLQQSQSFLEVHIGLLEIRAVHDALIYVWEALHELLDIILLRGLAQHLVGGRRLVGIQ